MARSLFIKTSNWASKELLRTGTHPLPGGVGVLVGERTGVKVIVNVAVGVGVLVAGAVFEGVKLDGGVNVVVEGRVLVGLKYGLGEGVQLGVELREGVNV